MPPIDPNHDAKERAATGAAWLLYLLIDPTTEATNHERGTVFFVGARPRARKAGVALRDRLDPRDLADPGSLPSHEQAARGRLVELMDRGVEPLVEVIADHRTWAQGHEAGDNDLTRMVAMLCATMRPAPLNAATAATREIVRYPASLVAAALEGRRAKLPDDRVVVYRLIQSEEPFSSVAELLDTSPSDLAEAMGEFTLQRDLTVLSREAEEQGLLWLLVTGAQLARGILPEGFVLGVWEVDRLDTVDGQLRLHTVESEWSAALRRHLLHTVIPVGLTREGLHRVEKA